MHTGPDPITDEQIQGYVLSVLKDKHGEYQRQAERNAKEADDKATMPRDRPVCRAWAEVSTRYADAFQVALRAAEMAFHVKAPTVTSTIATLQETGYVGEAMRLLAIGVGDHALAGSICFVASQVGAQDPKEDEANRAALDALCALWLVTRGKVATIHVTEPLTTASLKVGDIITVVTKLGNDEMIGARVLYADARQFVAESSLGIHRGGVSDRLGGRGPAYCERWFTEHRHVDLAIERAKAEAAEVSP